MLDSLYSPFLFDCVLLFKVTLSVEHTDVVKVSPLNHVILWWIGREA